MEWYEKTCPSIRYRLRNLPTEQASVYEASVTVAPLTVPNSAWQPMVENSPADYTGQVRVPASLFVSWVD